MADFFVPGSKRRGASKRLLVFRCFFLDNPRKQW